MEFVTVELVTQLFVAAYTATEAVETNKKQSAQIGRRISTILSLLARFKSSSRSRLETQDILENLHGISTEIIHFVEKFNNRKYLSKLWRNSTDFECFADCNNRLDVVIQLLTLGVTLSIAARAEQNDADARARSEDFRDRIAMLQLTPLQIAELTKPMKTLEGYIADGREDLAKLHCRDAKSARSPLRKILLSEVDWNKDGRIGEGTFGEVFKGVFKGEPVAIKVLKSSSEEDLKELENEAQIMQAIDHPCVVNMIAVVYNEWRAESSAMVSCIVMNLASCSLYKLLYSTKETLVNDGVRPPNSYLINWNSDRFFFSLAFRLALLKDITSAIAYIHSAGILHRDIKPSNVLIDRHYRGKVCDFGLAKVKKTANTLSISTMQTSAKGTLAYMPRETLQDCVYSKQGDVFAAGILVNEVLTGCNPFEGVSPNLLPFQISIGKRPRVMIPRENDGVSHDLLECITSCWYDDRGSRPTAEAVCSTVSRCLHVSGGDPRNKSSKEYVNEEPIEVSAVGITIDSSARKSNIALSGSSSLHPPPKPSQPFLPAPQASTTSNTSLGESTSRTGILSSLKHLNPFRRLTPAEEAARIAAKEKARKAAEEKARIEERSRIAAEGRARIAAEERARIAADRIAAPKKDEDGLLSAASNGKDSTVSLLKSNGADVMLTMWFIEYIWFWQYTWFASQSNPATERWVPSAKILDNGYQGDEYRGV